MQTSCGFRWIDTVNYELLYRDVTFAYLSFVRQEWDAISGCFLPPSAVFVDKAERER